MSSRLDVSTVECVLALSSVAGETAALGAHGDLATVHVLEDYYALGAAAALDAGGQIVKVMGGGILFRFPTARAAAAVAAIERFRVTSTELWQAFDARCRVQIRMTAGSVVVGPMGPPNDRREDVYGAALNALFKRQGEDSVIAPALTRMLGGAKR